MKRKAIILLLAVACLFATNSAAQNEAYYREPTHPKGHWKLFTDHRTRNTTITFFSADQQMLYQETLPGQYIKLTDRNRQIIDQAFNQFMQNQLIGGHIKASLLPVELPQKAKRAAGRPATVDPGIATTHAIRANAFFIENTARLKILFDNPTRRKINISLRDPSDWDVFTDCVSSSKYHRNLDLTGMRKGTYTLTITTPDRRYHYSRQVVVGAIRREVHLVAPSPELITQE
jgi:hypothetical protein